jgi:hypothetical protein
MLVSVDSAVFLIYPIGQGSFSAQTFSIPRLFAFPQKPNFSDLGSSYELVLLIHLL